MIAGTLSRYFGLRFLSAVVAVFAGTLLLTAMIDFLEMMRRSGDIHDISAFFIAKITLFRVPFITERVLPFAVLVGAMFCYLNLSRRLELVVARAAGISAWQFTAPAIAIALAIGVLMTAIYNPISAILREQATRLEGDLFGFDPGFRNPTTGFWLRQRTDEGQAVINAKSSRQQGIQLGGVSVFRYDKSGHFQDRIEARTAALEAGYWRLEAARFYVSGVAPSEREQFRLKTTLTAAQVGESFADSRDRAVLEPFIIHRGRREFGSERLRLQVAVLSTADSAILPRGNGASGSRGEFAVFPHGRGTEDSFGGDCGRFSALRHCEDHWRHE